ncbi:glycoside hydrolase family 88/105 protein [Oleiharenicola lentus]|uniref:glycoside hydrolase family 88/105 protein n=1 Tax=Oleiharenicola lentus TaxID=2508720 RepID=UPI003F676B6D
MTSKTITTLLLVGSLSVNAAWAEGSYRNRDAKNPHDLGEGTYPIPYQLPTVAEISQQLKQVRDYLEAASPRRVMDRETGETISDFTVPLASATLDGGKAGNGIISYEMGVVYSGMLYAGAVTGDPRFNRFVEDRLQFIHQHLPYFRAVGEKHGVQRGDFFKIIAPTKLDDCGAMTTALIRARLAGLGPDLTDVITPWAEWIGQRQFRLADGTLARKHPQPESVWADDFYMAVPALAELGRMTGERKWFDDAVRNALGMSERLFNPQNRLYTHGWSSNHPDAPQFYWGRGMGWTVMAMCDLLDVLPSDHPGYQPVLAQLRAALRGAAQYQSGAGFWHQLMDRPDSFYETSATAMFTYAIAHAINQGWISPTIYGPIAQAGWCALSSKIDWAGRIEGGVVATNYASDATYYYHRPMHFAALQGYGPALLAGAEMIKLLQNPAIEIRYEGRTYYYSPKVADGKN